MLRGAAGGAARAGHPGLIRHPRRLISRKPDEPAQVIARVAHPSHATVVDLDGDGLRDVLVANLGDYWPVDTTEGSVVWLRNRDKGRFDSVV